MQFMLIGTGSPRLHLHRAGTSQLAWIDPTHGILIDCGPGVMRRLIEADIDLSHIRTLLLTHHHYDHIADMAHFVLARWDHTHDPKPLNLVGPPGTQRIAELLFGAGGVYDSDITARTEHPMSQQVFAMRGGKLPRPRPSIAAQDVGHGLACQGDGWRVLAGPARHAQPFMDCYAYRIETPQRTVVVSGDTGTCPGLAAFARGADLLVHMCCLPDAVLQQRGMVECVGGPSLAGQVAAEAGARKLVLTHPQSDELDSDAGQAEAIRCAASFFNGEIVFGHDLMQV